MTQETERPSEAGEMPDPASQPEIPVQGPENEELPDDEGNDEDVPQAPGNGAAPSTVAVPVEPPTPPT